MFAQMPTMVEAGRAFRERRARPRDLVECCAEAIERLEPRLHAWVDYDLAEARAVADRLGARLDAGEDLGPLHGIPLGIKDLIDVAGWRTRAGSPLRANCWATEDAPVIAGLRQAGAIILGKTVTTEFACFDPAATVNPWNPAFTPGGSSSGSAAAVAAGMCPAALGSQTGGSIIRPASFCGITGFKPTYGRVPTEFVVPVSHHLDHVGPLARTVEDLQLLFWCMDRGARPAVPPWQAPAEGTLPNIRFVVFRDYFLTTADAEVQAACERALDILRSAGATCTTAALPAEFVDVHRHHRELMAREAAQVHRLDFLRHPAQFGPHVATLIRDGLEIDRQEWETGRYALALARRREFRAAMQRLLGDHTVALMPSTVTPAPKLDSTGDPRFNAPWSFAGIPTVTIPCGLSEAGLPCGLQLVGGADTDYSLLDVAAWCARQLAWDVRPPCG